MNYQFLTYAESKGYDVANMTAQEIDALKQALLLGKLTLPYVEFMTNYYKTAWCKRIIINEIV